MPRKKSGTPRKQRLKEVTVAAHLPNTPDELQPHVGKMCTGLAADAIFAPLKPQVDQTVTDNGALATAIQEAKGGGEVALEALLNADKTVRDDVKVLLPGIQRILRAQPPDEVPGILAAILLYASHVGERPPKPPIEAKDVKGAPPGTVAVVVLAVAGVLYYEYESSPDGTNWTFAGESGKSRYTIPGLTPAKGYFFRVTVHLRNGTLVQHATSAAFIVR